jgi:biotin synthase
LYEKAVQNRIVKSDLDSIINWPDSELSLLFACADQVRRCFFGNRVEPCAIMNIKSGGCSENCAFCAQSAHNKAEIKVQPLSSAEEITEAFRAAKRKNLPLGLVSSGRKLSTKEIGSIAEAITQWGGPVHASLGILTDEEFNLLKQAGVVCYNHNLETGRNFFPKIVTTHTYDQRIETVRRAKKAGMKICCGGIFGLGESWADRKELCLELARLDIDSIPLNFLNAVAGTALGKPRETPLEFLKIVSLFRIAHGPKKILVAGGREVNLGKLQPLIFFAGANGYISGDYLTTSGDPVESDDAMIAALRLRR